MAKTKLSTLTDAELKAQYEAKNPRGDICREEISYELAEIVRRWMEGVKDR